MYGKFEQNFEKIGKKKKRELMLVSIHYTVLRLLEVGSSR